MSLQEKSSRIVTGRQVGLSTASRWTSWETTVDGTSTTAHGAECRKGKGKGNFPWLKRSGTDCTIKEGRKHGWKPITTKKRVLLPFATISLMIAGLIEFLAQRSQRKGGLALSPSLDAIPPLVSFGYLFLPTIIAVIYSIFWSWIDLDTKRTQPWVELSRRDGATAENSLLLDYPYDFVAFVPFKAAKRRHWAVFVSGTVMMTIFWVLTPLQSAVFGASSVTVQAPSKFYTASRPAPVAEQAASLDPMILNTAFAIKYLQQAYPQFTTPDYTLLPFKAQGSAIPSSEAKNWTATTTKFHTDLKCWPATIQAAFTPSTWHFQDGRGCNSSDHAITLTEPFPYKLLYFGYHDEAEATDFLSRTSCHPDSTNIFLAVMTAYNPEDRENPPMTALFCETSYWKQKVVVTVSNGDFVPATNSIELAGDPEPLPMTEFNATGFEYLLGSGVSAVKMAREFPALRLQTHEDRVNGTGLAMPLSPMVGFAVANSGHEMTDYFNETLLADAFSAVHRSMFSVAFSRLLRRVNGTDPGEATNGLQTFVLHGVVVSRLFSAIVEGILASVAVSAIILYIICSRSESKLTHDPASLGDLIGIVRSSRQLLETFAKKDGLDEKQLLMAFANQDVRFCLQCACESPSGSMSINVTSSSRPRFLAVRLPPHTRSSSGLSGGDLTGHYNPVQPLALRRESGTVFVATLMGMLVALIYLRAKEQELGGLTRPTDSFEVLQLLENFIPTILATLVEPFWVLVNRLLCIIQPFKDLWIGKKNPRSSIDTRYTSVPPQLVLWRALRRGHFLLAVVCVVALLSNVLAVGLGGLFNEEPIRASTLVEFHHLSAAQFSDESIQKFNPDKVNLFYADHFIATLANISDGVSLPPWVTEKYYFQPFVAVNTDPSNGTEAFTGRTRGYAINLTCEAMEPTTQPPVIDLLDFKRRFEITDEYNCSDTFDFGGKDGILFLNQKEFDKPFAIEVSKRPCDKIWIGFYGRANNGTFPNVTVDSTIITCYPEFQTAMFDVTVDANGYVLNETRASDFESDLGYPQSKNHTDGLLRSMDLVWSRPGDWHNDSLSQSWVSYLIKVKTNSSAFLDPLEPPPDPEWLIPLLQEMNERQFALTLGFNPYLLPPDEAQPVFTGTTLAPETRIFMSRLAFIVSVVVLILNIIVALIVYGWAVKFFLPRMPTTIGSLLAYLAPSRAVKQYEKKQSETFSFGRYVGDDGKAHVGIEISKYVVPVDLVALKKGDIERRLTFVGRLRSRLRFRRDRNDDPWL